VEHAVYNRNALKSTTRRLTAAEFRDYYQTHYWKEFARAAREHAGYRCAITGDDWKNPPEPGLLWRLLKRLYRLLGKPVKEGNWLEVHHLQYVKNSRPIFYGETFDDVAVLWNRFHPRGRLTARQIATWRRNYWFRKRVRAGWRVLTREMPRAAWRLVRGVRP